MRELVAIGFTLFPVVAVLLIGLWRRKQIYRQEDASLRGRR